MKGFRGRPKGEPEEPDSVARVILGELPEFSAADGPAHRILEGTIIDTVLINRLDGAAAAPVNCLVSTPIYSTDAQVLVPAGARLLGTTKPVQSFGETRLAVGFTRIVMPAANVDPDDGSAGEAELVGVRTVGEALDQLI